MSVLRLHRYSVAPDSLPEFLRRREAVIAAVRWAHPGLTTTRLIRLDDGGYEDAWQWNSKAEMRAAAADLPSFPEAAAAMALTTGNVVQNGELIDER